MAVNIDGVYPLSQSIRRFMEPRFGVDFGHVRLHKDKLSQEMTSCIGARAFTYGDHVWLGEGSREENLRLMAHELAHVV